MRLPPPPACGTRIELRASPLARDPHARARAAFFLGIGTALVVPHLFLDLESQRLLALSLVVAAGFVAMAARALRMVSRARLDHAVVLTHDALSFRDARGRAVQVALANVLDARVAHPKNAALTAVVLWDDSGELVLPGEYLPFEWSTRDLATRIAFRAAYARMRGAAGDDMDVEAAVEALAVSGSDAALLELREERWRVRWTFNVPDARALIDAAPPSPHRIVCRSTVVDALRATLGHGYRDDGQHAVEPVSVPIVSV